MIGLGGLGQYGLKLLKLLAGCPIIVVDIHEQKLRLARELGATHTFNGRLKVLENSRFEVQFEATLWGTVKELREVIALAESGSSRRSRLNARHSSASMMCTRGSSAARFKGELLSHLRPERGRDVSR